MIWPISPWCQTPVRDESDTGRYAPSRWRRSPTAARFPSTGTPTRRCSGSSGSASSGGRGSTSGTRRRWPSRVRSWPAISPRSRVRSCASRTASCARSSTSAATAARSLADGEGQARVDPVPLPRVDVRPRRLAARRARAPSTSPASSTTELGLVPSRARLLGAVRLRQPGRRRRAARRHARRAARARRARRASTSTSLAHLNRRGGTSTTRTGRLRRELPRVLPLRRRPPGLLEAASTCRWTATGWSQPTCSRPSSRPCGREEWTGRRSTPGEIERGQFHFLWPNLKLNIEPGPPNLSIGPILPTARAAPRGFLDYLVRARTCPRAWMREFIAFDDQVGAEDKVLVERVQRGARPASSARPADGRERAPDRALPKQPARGARLTAQGTTNREHLVNSALVRLASSPARPSSTTSSPARARTRSRPPGAPSSASASTRTRRSRRPT